MIERQRSMTSVDCDGRLIALAVVVLMVLGACGSAPAPRNGALSLRIGVATVQVPPVPNSVLWLAEDGGFYRREGLDVTLLPLDGTPRVIAAMLTGDVDVGNVATDQVLQLVASARADLRALHSPDPRQFFLIAGAGRVDSVNRLRGATVAISAVGGVDDTTTRLVLRAKGIAASDLNFVALGAPSVRAAALMAGRIDATTISVGTWSTVSTSPAVHVLVSPQEYYDAAPLVAKVDAATASILRSKQEQVRRFTRAVLEAVRFYAHDRRAWVAAMMRRRPELDPSILSELWDGFRDGWAVNGGMDPAQLRTTEDILYEGDELKGLPRVAVSRWTDLTDLKAVLRELGPT